MFFSGFIGKNCKNNIRNMFVLEQQSRGSQRVTRVKGAEKETKKTATDGDRRRANGVERVVEVKFQ